MIRLLRNKCPLLHRACNTLSPLKTGLSAACYIVTSLFTYIYIKVVKIIYIYTLKRCNDVTRAKIARNGPFYKGFLRYMPFVAALHCYVTVTSRYITGPATRPVQAASPRAPARRYVAAGCSYA